MATQDQQRDVERNILQLIDALKEESQRLAKQQRRGGGGGGRGQPRPAPLVPPLAQLKQLRTLQKSINEGTRSIELDKVTRRRARERLRESRALRLSRKQHELGKLTDDFAKALEEATEERMGPP